MACTKCGKDEPLAPRRAHCKVCEAEYQRNYRLKNIERIKAGEATRYRAKREDQDFVQYSRKRGREYWQNLRREVINAYGGPTCACCGETEYKFLSIDHVLNDGADHRRSICTTEGNGKGAGGRTWVWLKRNGFPSGFQVLCMNCNFGKATNGGVCPHESKQSAKAYEFGDSPHKGYPGQSILQTGFKTWP